MDVIIGILGIAFTIGGAILVHEFGHFVFAKMFGVGVEVFSIGFGKKLLKIKKGETTYAIGVIPVGGYVQLKGVLSPEELSDKEKPREEKVEEKADADDTKKKKSLMEITYDDQRALRNKRLSTKVAIFASGVFMNYLTAVFVLALLAFVGYEQDAPLESKIGLVESTVLQDKYGVKAGDEIEEVNGEKVETWDEMSERVVNLYRNDVAQEMEMKIRRGGRDSIVTLPLYLGDGKTTPVFAFFHPYIPAYVGGIIPNKPAEKSGLQEGDIIVSINNVETPTWWHMVTLIRENAGKETVFRIKRGEEIVDISVTPKSSAEEPGIGEIGIVIGNPNKIIVKKSLPGAIGFGFSRSVGVTWLILDVSYDMFKRMNLELAKENVGGPVAIAIVSYKAAKRNLQTLLQFFAAFNIMLVILNVLPIPLFDGGHIMIALVEATVRRPIPAKILVKVYAVVMVLLLSLFVLVTYNDILMNLWRIGR